MITGSRPFAIVNGPSFEMVAKSLESTCCHFYEGDFRKIVNVEFTVDSPIHLHNVAGDGVEDEYTQRVVTAIVGFTLNAGVEPGDCKLQAMVKVPGQKLRNGLVDNDGRSVAIWYNTISRRGSIILPGTIDVDARKG